MPNFKIKGRQAYITFKIQIIYITAIPKKVFMFNKISIKNKIELLP